MLNCISVFRDTVSRGALEELSILPVSGYYLAPPNNVTFYSVVYLSRMSLYVTKKTSEFSKIYNSIKKCLKRLFYKFLK